MSRKVWHWCWIRTRGRARGCHGALRSACRGRVPLRAASHRSPRRRQRRRPARLPAGYASIRGRAGAREPAGLADQGDEASRAEPAPRPARHALGRDRGRRCRSRPTRARSRRSPRCGRRCGRCREPAPCVGAAALERALPGRDRRRPRDDAGRRRSRCACQGDARRRARGGRLGVCRRSRPARPHARSDSRARGAPGRLPALPHGAVAADARLGIRHGVRARVRAPGRHRPRLGDPGFGASGAAAGASATGAAAGTGGGGAAVWTARRPRRPGS